MPQVSKIMVRLWSAFLAVLFLAVSILGIVAIVVVKTFPGVGVGLLVFGIVGLVVSIAGVAGAGFEKDPDNGVKSKYANFSAILLVVFFSVMCILQVLFIIFGVVLIAVRPAVKMIITLPPSSFKKIFESLPSSFKGSVDDAILKIQKFSLALGIIMIIVSIIILLTCVAAAYQMGSLLFAKFYILSFSIIEMIIGISFAVLLLIINHTNNTTFFGNQIGKNVIVPVVLFGFFLTIIGIVGFITIFLGHKYKIIGFVFNFGNTILLIGFVVLFILCMVYHGLIVGWANGLCKVEDDVDTCTATVEKAIANACPDADASATPCYNDNELKKDAAQMFRGFTSILSFVCAYLSVFLSFVVASTWITSLRRKEVEADDEAKKPLYS